MYSLFNVDSSIRKHFNLTLSFINVSGKGLLYSVEFLNYIYFYVDRSTFFMNNKYTVTRNWLIELINIFTSGVQFS